MKLELSDGNTFEIPDSWWNGAGMMGFSPAVTAYRARPLDAFPDHPIAKVPVYEIEPPRRSPGIVFDCGGFKKEKMVPVLACLANSVPMEPIKVREISSGKYRYVVRDGFHRFHASVAAGFVDVPVAVGEWGV